jgi:metal transporter CNNM
MESLPILLAYFGVGTVGTLLISVFLVLILGEIVPQALFSHRPLSFCGSWPLSCLVRLLIFLLYPVGYFLAKILDCVLPDERRILFHRSEMERLLELHCQVVPNRIGTNEPRALLPGEASIMRGALDLHKLSASSVMTPLSSMFCIDVAQHGRLDQNLLLDIHQSGYSRIPVCCGSVHNVVGVLLVKRLLLLNPEQQADLLSFVQRKPMVRNTYFNGLYFNF